MGGADLALRELERGEHRALRAAGAERGRTHRQLADRGGGGRLVRRDLPLARRDGVDVDAGRLHLGEERGQAREQHVGRIFARLGQHPLAEHPGLDVGAAQFGIDSLLHIVGIALLDDEHRALAGAEVAQLLRHQRIGDVEAIDRDARTAEQVGEPQPFERARDAIVEPAERDDADLGEVARKELVEFLGADEFLRRRLALLDLELFVQERDRRVGEPRVVEFGRAGQAVDAGEFGAPVVLGLELAGDVAGADAQFEHHRRVARLGELEPLLDHAHDRRQIRPRIEQPYRGLHRIGVGALLDDTRAFAVILAEDDHGAADHAGRGEVGQRVRRHIGADDRLPGDGAAQRVVDRGTEHGGRRGLVGAGLDMHAEIGEQVLGIHHHVEQVRYRRALVAADIAHARLQQRLGDREDAFAPKGFAVAEPERLDFLLE